MKKFLLSLIALLGVVSANAQVTETDLTAYDDVIYAENLNVLEGTTEANLTIKVKSHSNFQAVEFYLVLPEGATLVDLNGLEQSRRQYVEAKGSDVYEYNNHGEAYQIIATATCDRGFASGDDAYSYITIDVSELEAGEYPVIVKDATISGFISAEDGVATGDADFVLADEVTTKIVVSNELVLNEADTQLPAFDNNTTTDVKLYRTFKKGEWSTIVLPFRLTAANAKAMFGSNVKFASFGGFTTEFEDDDESKAVTSITINFNNHTGALNAGTPYLIQINDDVKEFYSASGMRLNSALQVVEAYDEVAFEGELSGRFIGTYGKTVIPENGLFISGDKFWYSTGKTNIKGFRGWFELDAVLNQAVSSGVKMNINVGDETGIDDIRVDTKGAVYTLDGKFIGRDVDLKKLQKGIYVVDGKKVAIK